MKDKPVFNFRKKLFQRLVFINFIIMIVIIYIIVFFGFYYASILFGLLSVGIGCLAYWIAEDTDKKIKNLMKAFFMDITYEFEQTKNRIKENPNKDFRGYETWRLKRLLDRAIHIKSDVDSNLQEDFVKYYCSGNNSLIEGLRHRKNNLNEALGEEEKSNLKDIYNKLKELDLENIKIEYPKDLIDD